jgi:hypothetical protein
VSVSLRGGGIGFAEPGPAYPSSRGGVLVPHHALFPGDEGLEFQEKRRNIKWINSENWYDAWREGGQDTRSSTPE